MVKTMSQHTLLFLAVVTASAVHADEPHQTYSIEDLRALAKGRGGDEPTSGEVWGELVEHLRDILPSRRGSEWEALAEKASTGYIQGLLAEQKAEAALAAAEELRNRYPHLKRSKTFMAQRTRAGLAGFELCYQRERTPQRPTCTERLLAFVDGDASNAGLAMSAGKLVRLNQNHAQAAPFFRRALANRPGAPECQDEDLRLAVLSGLGLPSDYPHAADARKLAATLCAEALLDPIRKELEKDAGGYFKENVCAALGKKAAPPAAQCP